MAETDTVVARDFWLQYDQQAGRWCVENESPKVIRPNAEVIHTREVSAIARLQAENEALRAAVSDNTDIADGLEILVDAATARAAAAKAENEALRRELGEERDESMWRFWRDKAAALATKCDAANARAEAAEAKAARLEEAIHAVQDATAAYLPPDGIDAQECLNRILQATDNPTINAITLGAQYGRP